MRLDLRSLPTSMLSTVASCTKPLLLFPAGRTMAIRGKVIRAAHRCHPESNESFADEQSKMVSQRNLQIG